jgi:Glucose dehydrogenase
MRTSSDCHGCHQRLVAHAFRPANRRAGSPEGLRYFTRNHSAFSAFSAVAFLCLAVSLSAQITPERLANAASEPQQWMMYSGAYDGSRFSPLDQINRTNVQRSRCSGCFRPACAAVTRRRRW